MTRIMKLLSMCGVLVMLLVATVAVKLAAETEDEIAVDVVYAVDFDTAAVTELSWQVGETAFSFVKDENNWTYPADNSFPVSTDSVTNLLNQLTTVKVEKTVDGARSDFGFTVPACVITLNGSSPHIITIGDESAMGGQRYMTVDDSPVYLVDDSILGEFTAELYDFLKEESIPNMKNVTAITVERKGTDLVLKSETDEEGNTVWHGLVKDEEFELDTTLVKNFTDTVTTMYWADTVEHNADKKALKSYGLDKPAAVLTVDYQVTTQTPTDMTDSDGITNMADVTTDHSFVLELGSTTEEGCYVRLANSNMVYELYESYSYELLNITIEDLMPMEE